MTYINADQLLRDLDEAANAVQHELTKAWNILGEAKRAAERGKAEQMADQIVGAQRRLDKAQGALQFPALTQYRMRVAVPKEVRKQASIGPPDDLICRKCGERRAREDFRWDDGIESGYTLRCSACRSPVGKRAAQRKWAREHA